jgi:hypothetical protein
MDAARLFGSGLSLLGTLFQLAVIAETVPVVTGVPICIDCVAPPPLLIGHWTPFIENLGDGDRPSETSRCPGRQWAGTSFRLDHAPLPPAFRPFDYSDKLLACVRVDARGSVRSVRLIAGTGKDSLDRQLVQTVYRQWRFAPHGDIPIRPGWQRIRLSARPPEAVAKIG